MSDRLVLVDSSAWITHFTMPHAALSHGLAHLLSAHRAALNDVIRLEVLTGARDEAQYAQLEDALQGLRVLPLSDTVWRRAERLRFDLRREGYLIPVPDVLVAACAITYDCDLLHADRHFTAIAKFAPLSIYRATP